MVVGGGPTGVELAGTSRRSRATCSRRFRSIDPSSARMILLEGRTARAACLSRKSVAQRRRQLRHLGVEVSTNALVTGSKLAWSAWRHAYPSRTVVLWAAGVAASPAGEETGRSLDRAGRVFVSPISASRASRGLRHRRPGRHERRTASPSRVSLPQRFRKASTPRKNPATSTEKPASPFITGTRERLRPSAATPPSPSSARFTSPDSSPGCRGSSSISTFSSDSETACWCSSSGSGRTRPMSAAHVSSPAKPRCPAGRECTHRIARLRTKSFPRPAPGSGQLARLAIIELSCALFVSSSIVPRFWPVAPAARALKVRRAPPKLLLSCLLRMPRALPACNGSAKPSLPS